MNEKTVSYLLRFLKLLIILFKSFMSKEPSSALLITEFKFFCHLKWKDIDEVNQTLTVRRVLAQGEHGTIFQSPKTKASHRTISIDNITMDLLVNWRNIQRKDLLSFGINANGPEQLVFTNQKNNPLNLYYIGTALQRITKLHKLKHINVHGFRHTHCALLFEAKLEMKEVQERLGHANIETTMNIYDHVTQNRRDEAAEKFAQFMSF
ncbi:site-specific integrase [Ruoffia sp. FAM 24228]